MGSLIIEPADFAIDLIFDEVKLWITSVTEQGLRTVVNKATRGEVQEHDNVYDSFQPDNGGGAAENFSDERQLLQDSCFYISISTVTDGLLRTPMEFDLFCKNPKDPPSILTNALFDY
jgi:hypothetical protein